MGVGDEGFCLTEEVTLKATLVIAVMFLIAAESALCDPRLAGTWRSDAGLTIQSIETVRELTPEDRERFGDVLGKMTMSFGPDAVVVDWGEPGSKEMRVPFEVLEAGEKHVTLEFHDRQGGATETVRYRFEGDCIKRRLVPEGWFEYFCRVQ